MTVVDYSEKSFALVGAKNGTFLSRPGVMGGLWIRLYRVLNYKGHHVILLATITYYQMQN